MAGGTTVQPIVFNGCGLKPKGFASVGIEATIWWFWCVSPLLVPVDQGSHPPNGFKVSDLICLHRAGCFGVGWVVVLFLEWVLGLRCFLT
ncbi:hypothetical protein A2U01_0031574 [Trifolium medium]|uniref:Uncharacterized protein n=1 Tax=Trifolium medium TaxID=97028 RepID=A0A392PEC5_9FABA|nr:hypothetical protein [Trifolium medium]